MHIIFKVLLILIVPLFGIGTQFLVLPFSTQEMSLGPHPALPGSSPTNPALFTAYEDHPVFGLDRGTWFGDIVLAQFGYNLNRNNFINHLGIKYASITDLEFRKEIPQDDALAQFTSYGLAFDVGTAFARGSQKFGISLSYIQFGIFTEKSTGIGLSFGYARDLKRGLKIGIALNNLGKMGPLNSRSPALPNRFLAGGSKKLVFNEYINILYGSIGYNSITGGNTLYFGNSFNWNRLSINAGLSSSKDIIQSSMGFRLNIQRYAVEYGIRFGPQALGIPQMITLRIILP